MIILLPTVKHTGSHFVLNQLLKDFIRIDLKNAKKQICEIEKDGCFNGVVFDHLFPHKMKLWEKLFEKHRAIIPIRNKHEVWKSWRKRSNEPDRDLFDQMWEIVENLDKYDPFYINIDNQEIRDKQLDFINKELKLKLNADGWPVVRK
jgi:hypothetical protein